MALTLTAGIDADDNVLAVTGTVPGTIATGYLFALENEILRLKGFNGVLPPFPVPVNKQAWRVERGVNGTVAVSHALGVELFAVRDAFVKAADLTPPGPFLTGGVLAASKAAYVDPELATPEAICDALIAAGLMEAAP